MVKIRQTPIKSVYDPGYFIRKVTYETRFRE